MQTAAPRSMKALHRFGPPVLVTLGVLWLLQGALARTSSHGVIIQSLNYNAGAVKAGSTVTDTVRIINLSSQPIEIDAQPGCGCTVAEVPEKPLAPLHSEVVRLEVSTDGMGKGELEKGVVFKMQSGNIAWERVATVKFRLR